MPVRGAGVDASEDPGGVRWVVGPRERCARRPSRSRVGGDARSSQPGQAEDCARGAHRQRRTYLAESPTQRDSSPVYNHWARAANAAGRPTTTRTGEPDAGAARSRLEDDPGGGPRGADARRRAAGTRRRTGGAGPRRPDVPRGRCNARGDPCRPVYEGEEPGRLLDGRDRERLPLALCASEDPPALAHGRRQSVPLPQERPVRRGGSSFGHCSSNREPPTNRSPAAST
jgi:hypothetical protein